MITMEYHRVYSNKKGCPLSFIAISQGAVRGAQFQQQLDLQRQQIDLHNNNIIVIFIV
jgi:hypothetical protein